MIRKRTKIVATISDKNCEQEFIRELYNAGMDVVRINSAHLKPEGALRIINNVRKVSDKIAIIIDTKGPEIRTTECDAPIHVKKGTQLKLKGDPDSKSSGSRIYVTLKSFSDDVPPGSPVMIDDGDIELKAIRKKEIRLSAELLTKA